MITLSDRERQVIEWKHVDRMSLQQIAKLLKISDTRVSQVHSAAVLKLRMMGNVSAVG